MPLENSPALCAYKHELIFESYGVRVKIGASDTKLLAEAERRTRKALVDNVRPVDDIDTDCSFGIASDESGTLHLYKNGEAFTFDRNRQRFFKFFDSMLRLAVAEHATGWVFIHAGVVAVKGRAIVIPGDSFSGKTTLVKELVKAGAEYYSDEYAVLDTAGLVHAFPRDLSVRYNKGGSIAEREINVESIGGKTGTGPVPVGLLVLTRFVEGSVWEPETQTVGQGILETIPHTISRIANTAHSLKVLNTALSDAIILKSSRGDAAKLALTLLSFF